MSQLTIAADAHARLNMLDEMHSRRDAGTSTRAANPHPHEPLLDLASAMARFGSTTVADWFDADEGF